MRMTLNASPDLVLRRAMTQDLDVLVALNQHLIEDQAHNNPASAEQLRSRMQGWLTGAYSVSLIEAAGHPAAYAVWRDDGEWIYLRQFFVVRQLRRSGVGRRAFAALEREWGPREVMLDVLLHNERAFGFWRSLGFRDYSLILRRSLVAGQNDEYASATPDGPRGVAVGSSPLRSVAASPVGAQQDSAEIG